MVFSICPPVIKTQTFWSSREKGVGLRWWWCGGRNNKCDCMGWCAKVIRLRDFARNLLPQKRIQFGQMSKKSSLPLLSMFFVSLCKLAFPRVAGWGNFHGPAGPEAIICGPDKQWLLPCKGWLAHQYAVNGPSDDQEYLKESSHGYMGPRKEQLCI